MSKDGDAILDFSNRKVKQMVLDHIKNLSGLYRFSIKRCRAQRSLQANAFYWGVILKCVQAGIEEAWGERRSVEWCHCYMKKRFLLEPVVNKHTGEVIDEAVGSTAELNKDEFTEYLNNIIKFCAEELGVEVPDSIGSIAA